MLSLRYFIYILTVLLLIGGSAIAQIPLATDPGQQRPSAREMKRYEIDAKRIGVEPESNDALPRSREFIRIDSTYYVGWFYEGAYKYNHAADLLGFKNASIPLERALYLMERDYKKELATRTSDFFTYYPVYRFQTDYTHIAYYLVNCYSNMEEPQKVYDLLKRVLRWNFQRDYYMDAYNYLAWTVHRNRFYTSSQYSFLGNSIEENEQLAHRYLDSGIRKIELDRRVNSEIFPPGYERYDKLAVYHYKAILYSYALNIDSAERYYRLMRNSSIFPHNNYATFRAICGDFRSAEAYYERAAGQETGDKRLKEYIYYTSILDIYKGNPQRAMQFLRDVIRANGSTPGFGWYNIALARSFYYDGQIKESAQTIEKAQQFRELHIGTTLGQSHYDFSIQLNKLMNREAEWEMQRFENRNWWYNPMVLGKMGQILGEKYMQQFLIINQFAQNPEREQVIYKLFSTESTVNWDEIWFLIKDFSTRFFLNRFQKELSADDRPLIKKYYQLFVAKLHMTQDNYEQAQRLLDVILADETIDVDYEKLFLARVYEAKAKCADKLKDQQGREKWLYQMYRVYPQLVPYSGLRMPIHLTVEGNAEPQVIERLKACNIEWANPSQSQSVRAIIRFVKNGDRKYIEYQVVDVDGSELVANHAFSWKDPSEAGVELAYRLFGIRGKISVED